mmetsp:Transcript_61173/g.138395  ORF Transcript_61173/g.138395 Transcript_61173/m.138395 type:complete len:326 (+) Transcript_61173:216-1193(+)|eukprot:CAMPEP_0172610656 /NCGR_PEP_ID=MMETSP1068-20121228/30434_1 /TAXON_ID=35684 /ORGANISM="Pseudopedinella elastica, Strain CCMP716" /LENGTH=325 /DNA_ID=CAMNT_0013414423 /DNA_START=188 /DNA_END=1165 /DNA_ORIENTATION=+
MASLAFKAFAATSLLASTASSFAPPANAPSSYAVHVGSTRPRTPNSPPRARRAVLARLRSSPPTEFPAVPAELQPVTGVVKGPGGGKAPVLVLDGDTLDTLPEHVALVAGLWLLSAVALAPCAAALVVQPGAAGLGLLQVFVASVVFSDFFSGLFHWATDNYGNRNTPVFGGVIEAFQGHHVNPWTITHRGFFNNVHKIALSALPLLGLMMLVSADPAWRLACVVFVNAQLLSQEFHKLAHTVKPPGWATFLQGKGLIIGRRAHGMHHTTPFEAHYCILTGWCNDVLDRLLVWRRAEALVFRINGQEPNCWKDDPSLKEKSLALL